MMAWIITGGVVLLLLLLLCLPVSVRVSWQGGDPKATLHYACLRLLDFSPEKEVEKGERKARKALKKESRKQIEEEENKQKDGAKARGLWDTAKLVWRLLLDARWALNLLRRHLVFYKVKLFMSIGREDAHQTAVAYGNTAAAVHTGVGVLSELFSLHRPVIYLAPDFSGQPSRYDISFRVRILPLFVVIGGMGFLANLLKNLTRSGRREKRRRKRMKQAIVDQTANKSTAGGRQEKSHRANP